MHANEKGVLIYFLHEELNLSLLKDLEYLQHFSELIYIYCITISAKKSASQKRAVQNVRSMFRAISEIVEILS